MSLNINLPISGKSFVSIFSENMNNQIFSDVFRVDKNISLAC